MKKKLEFQISTIKTRLVTILYYNKVKVKIAMFDEKTTHNPKIYGNMAVKQ